MTLSRKTRSDRKKITFDRGESMKTRFYLAILLAAFLAGGTICKPACAEKLSGTITISGAWAIYPLVEKWAEAFRIINPDVKIDISAGGAGKGMTDALTGAVDIGMVSREIDPSEKERGAYPIFVAKDAVFPVISVKNPAYKQIMAKGISRDNFKKLYIDSVSFSWKQLTGGPNLPVQVYTRSDSCGAAGAWATFLGKYKQENLVGTGVYGDPGLLEAVRRNPLGIGYNNLCYAFTGNKPTKGIAIVPIDINNNGKADPNETIKTRKAAYAQISAYKYPAARKEYLVTKGKPQKVTSEFIKFALSNEGVKIMNKLGGYVPLTDNETKAQIKRL